MSDDSDDPVMALLATQRAVLAAVENLAGQIEAMRDVLDQIVAGSAGAVVGGAYRAMSLGDRFRAATGQESARDPALHNAQSQYVVAQAIARGLHKGDPEGAAREAVRVREWIADQLDQGRVFEPAKVRDGDKGAVAVVEPIHEEMFSGRVRVV